MTTFDFICAAGQVSMPPIRVHRPTPTLICSAGYSIWWPEGKEFQNDRYAECVKYEPAFGESKSTPVTSGNGSIFVGRGNEVSKSGMALTAGV